MVDDDPAVRQALTRALALEGYDVRVAVDGRDALDRLGHGPVDLLVLDVGLPQVDGLEVARRVRRSGDETPILMVTARGAVDERVDGLDAGADDYLVKPFALAELRARVRALLRRRPVTSAQAPMESLSFADVRIDAATLDVFRGSRRIALTRTEHDLLRYFLEHPRQTLSRVQLFEGVWGYDFGPSSNALGVYIGYLRRKLEDGGEPRLLFTVRGMGYILREAP